MVQPCRITEELQTKQKAQQIKWLAYLKKLNMSRYLFNSSSLSLSAFQQCSAIEVLSVSYLEIYKIQGLKT
jgi:hypothetical protein